MVCVWVPRYGCGGPLNYQGTYVASYKASPNQQQPQHVLRYYVDVQGIANSVSGGSVPLSMLSTEDYLDQNGRIAVHAIRLP